MSNDHSDRVALPHVLERNLSSGTIPRLNALRAISAFIVVAYHYGLDYIPTGFGVLSFFVISGFLITWLLIKEHEQTGAVSLRNFYARRVLRIFPAFYVYWFVIVIVFVIANKKLIWPQALAAFFYVTNYYQGLNGYPNSALSHTWSLAIEEQFYILWPVLFLLFARRPKSLLGGLIAWIITVNVYRIGLHAIGVREEYIYTALDTRIDHLLVGCALAVALKNKLIAPLWHLVAHGAALCLVIALLAVSIFTGQVFGIPYRNTIGFAIDPLLIALLVAGLLSREGRAVNWMDSRPLVYLGAISYSTYLYQQIVLWPVAQTMRSFGTPEPITFLGCTAAVWFVAALSYAFIERPFLKLKKRFGATATSPAESISELNPRDLRAELAPQ